MLASSSIAVTPAAGATHANEFAMQANKKAVLLMQLHDFRGALKIFGRAIEALVKVVDFVDNTDSSGSANFQPANNCCEQWHTIQDSNCAPSSSGNNSAGNTRRNDSSYLIRQALTLEGVAPAHNDVPNSFGAAEVVTAILYNCGLANHLIGIESGSRNYLHRALCLYNLALKARPVVAHHQEEGAEDGDSDMIAIGVPTEELPVSMIVLALLNNKGQVHHELGSHYEAYHAFALLLEEWGMIMMKKGGEDIQQRFLDANTCCGLALNLYMFSEEPKSAPAA